MNNGCIEILEAKVADHDDRAKKLYRYVSDVARRINDATVGCCTISDLFATNIEVLRQKLRDNCEKLLFLDPVNNGKKALELLWRKVYYDTVSLARKLREGDNEYDSYLFTHIVCGIGQFHHFITRIQSELKIQFNELDYVPLMNDEEVEVTAESSPVDELQFGRFAVHTCLIYLGDLSRYQAELFHTFDPSVAARYYLQAAHIDMNSGMPYNQLGNLYLDRNYNLDSVCYYIHCLGCVEPFEGALGNLTKIFQKNSQFIEIINESESLTQTELIQNVISNFLNLVDIWYFTKNDTNIPERCNTIAQQLKVAMDFTMSPLPDININYEEYLQTLEEENINPSYMNGNLIHKITQICLFTLAKLIEIDEQQAFACKAFTLALLSQLLQNILKQLESMGLKNPASKHKARKIDTIKNPSEPEIEENKPMLEVIVKEKITKEELENVVEQEMSNEDFGTKPQNGDVKTIYKKPLAKRRRRRRVVSSESSDLSDAETQSSEVDSEQSYSDEEDLSDSTYKSDDDSKSEESLEDGFDCEGLPDNQNNEVATDKNKNIKENLLITNTDKTNETLEKSQDKPKPNVDLKLNAIQNFLLGDNYLPSIKLLLDWILTEKDLIISCGESGESLFQCMVNILNIFSFYFNSKNTESMMNDTCKIFNYAQSVAIKLKLEFKTIPLPEDINLRGTNICKFDKDAAEWQILDKYKPSIYEENIIRILNFLDFGDQMTKIVPRIRYNRTLQIFYLKKISHPKLNVKINHKRSREWHNSKKQHVEVNEGGLLRRLGRLWLASQVRELERSGQSPAPAFLALDSATLHLHLRRVKQILRSRNFILLVPSVVLQELDDLKRERSTARDAIRWLEIQLRSGSRFLRAQRPGQTKALPLLKYPRKAPTHVGNFIQILEFCNHFIADEKNNQGGNGDSENSLHGKSAPLLILLVGNEPGKEEEPYKEFSVCGAAQTAGISIEYIGDFYSKWRQTLHKTGKKR